MPRFFFHFVHKGGWTRDVEGHELANLRKAHEYAVLLIEQATCHYEDAADWRNWLIQITDNRGRPLLTVLFPARLSGRPARLRPRQKQLSP
jgi:hypothetical protein